MVSVYDPSYSNVYNSNSFMQLLENVSALTVCAYNDENGPNNLILGATSNVIIQGMQGVQMYINDSNSFQIYTTDSQGSNPTPIFAIMYSNNTTLINSSNLSFNGQSASIGSAVILDSNGYQYFGTSNADGFLFDGSLMVNSNSSIFGNIVGYQNLAISGNMFGSTMNLFQLNPNTTKTSNLVLVGYSLHINSFNQLELLRTDKLITESNYTNKVTRVMTFGNTEFNNQDKDNPENFTIMQDFQSNLPSVSNVSFTGGTSTYAALSTSFSSNAASFASNHTITTSNQLYPMCGYSVSASAYASNALSPQIHNNVKYAKSSNTYTVSNNTFNDRLTLSNFIIKPGNYVFSSSTVFSSPSPNKTAVIKYTMSNANGATQSIYEPTTSNDTGPANKDSHLSITDYIYLPQGSNTIHMLVATDDIVTFKHTTMGLQFSHA